MTNKLTQLNYRWLLYPLAILLCLTFSPTSMATLITIDFDSGLTMGNTYTENGVIFSEVGGVMFGPADGGHLQLFDSNGDSSNNLQSSGSHGCCHIDIYFADGYIFDLTSVDVSADTGLNQLTASSGAIFGIDGVNIYDFTTIPGWSNLSSLHLDDIAGLSIESMVFDVHKVSEPFTIFLLGLGLIIMAYSRREFVSRS